MKKVLIFFAFIAVAIFTMVMLKPSDQQVRQYMVSQVTEKTLGLPNNEVVSYVGDMAFDYFFQIVDCGICKYVKDRSTGKRVGMAMFGMVWQITEDNPEISA